MDLVTDGARIYYLSELSGGHVVMVVAVGKSSATRAPLFSVNPAGSAGGLAPDGSRPSTNDIGSQRARALAAELP